MESWSTSLERHSSKPAYLFETSGGQRCSQALLQSSDLCVKSHLPVAIAISTVTKQCTYLLNSIRRDVTEFIQALRKVD